ncbi:MAG: hypothetical protein HZC55_21920 [Verrucomicrobia bacterium]|nr:hypothetical protein [Verrucomicrobiota bacterium]
MNAPWPRLLRWRLPAAGLALVAFWAVLAGRFWHPYYGFTRFVQLDEADHRNGIREVREHPVFVYRGFNGYDGAAYLQLAFHPLLDSAELKPALDNLSYRARRILGSALAWLLAGGRPEHIAPTYAALNLGVWLCLAALLWRALPVVDARSWCAWAGVVLSAGALHSVRLALTDLLAVTLTTAAIHLQEKGRSRTALVALAVAGLARETALVAVVALWRGPVSSPRAWLENGLRAALAALPLVGWMTYVRARVGPADQGLGNLTWPVVGWLEKWGDTLADFVRHPDFRLLIFTTLLATIALTGQAAYVLRRVRWADPWWRLGAAGTTLMALLGTAVWEGHPGAATRVLLPLAVAFAVLAARERAGWLWLAVGGLSVGSGVMALAEVPQQTRELAAGRGNGGAFVATVGEGWFGIERGRGAAWVWAAERGELVIAVQPRAMADGRVRLRVRGITPRPLEVRQAGLVIFRGNLTTDYAWIDLPPLATGPNGELRLELASPAPPVRENPTPGARALGFALRGVEMR